MAAHQRPSRGALRAQLAPLLSLLAAPAAAQAPLAITNPSFEQPAIPAGTFSTTAPPFGWEVYGQGIDFGNRTIGVLNPNTTALYGSPVPDGQNVGVVFLLDNPSDQTVFAGIEAGMQQTLAATLAPNTAYQLRVEVGNITDDPNPPHSQFQFDGFPGYRIELLAGGVPLACDDDTLLPAEGGFLTSTVDFTSDASHAQLGQSLGVRLVNLNAAPGLEVNFDRVALTAACAPLAAAETVRVGTPANPAALLPGQTSGPVLGATWDPVIDHGAFAPGAVLDFLAIGPASSNLPSPVGTILCGLAPPLVVTSAPGLAFALPLPDDCVNVGTALCAQGGSVDAGGALALTNALDVTLGTF
ncbi:MAG: hypothetical protein AAF682_13250 [Planctomycetota bacterium]